MTSRISILLVGLLVFFAVPTFARQPRTSWVADDPSLCLITAGVRSGYPYQTGVVFGVTSPDHYSVLLSFDRGTPGSSLGIDCTGMLVRMTGWLRLTGRFTVAYNASAHNNPHTASFIGVWPRLHIEFVPFDFLRFRVHEGFMTTFTMRMAQFVPELHTLLIDGPGSVPLGYFPVPLADTRHTPGISAQLNISPRVVLETEVSALMKSHAPDHVALLGNTVLVTRVGLTVGLGWVKM